MTRVLPSLLRRAVSEAIGTFCLVFFGVGSVAADAVTGGVLGPLGIAVAFTFVVAAVIYATGHVSGAHINPAVTIAFWSGGHFPARDVPVYVVAQCVGGVAGAGLLAWATGVGAEVGVTSPGVASGRALALEVFLTFALMFVIVAVATDDRVPDAVPGAAVGMAVGIGALAGGPFTGGSMNPARSLAPAIVSDSWAAHWIYWVGPIAGAILGVVVYERLRPASVPPGIGRMPLGVEGPIGPASGVADG